MAKTTLDKGGVLMSPINKHVHLTEAELKQYMFAEHQLTKIEIEHIELELQLCVTCSNRYINLLDNLVIPNEPVLTDQIYDQLLTKIEEDQAKTVVVPMKRRWFEQPFVHVVVAASITGLLFVSGFLSVVTNAMLEEEVSTSPLTKFEEQSTWFQLNEIEWFKQLEDELLKLKQLELFKEEKSE